MKGTIKWYNDRKGFGFIEVEDGKDVFVHRTSLSEETYLAEGDNVEFETEESERGPQATKVKKVTNA
jgi:CspA family cold shock protein